MTPFLFAKIWLGFVLALAVAVAVAALGTACYFEPKIAIVALLFVAILLTFRAIEVVYSDRYR